MRKITLILAVITLFVNISFAQFTGNSEQTKYDPAAKNILGFINLKNFSWTNTINMSFTSLGGASYSLASYTGTLAYRLRNNMNISADITMQYAPYANLGTHSLADNRSFQNYLSGVNVSRVSFNWQPFKNMFVNFQYVNPKSANYYNGFDNFYYPRYFGY